MVSSESSTFAAEPYTSLLEQFFGALDKRDPDSFFAALAIFDGIDVTALAASHITAIAKQFYSGSRSDRQAVAGYFPFFGHVRIASRNDVTIGFSVQSAEPAKSTTVASSARSEFHRIERGSLELVECTKVEGSAGYLPMTKQILRAGDELKRRAGESAFMMRSLECSHVFGISGWSQFSLNDNVVAATGIPISQAFSSEEDSILVNILELCTLVRDEELATEALSFVEHDNHRVRLSALKASLTGRLSDPERLAALASRDTHQAIRQIGIRMLEALA